MHPILDQFNVAIIAGRHYFAEVASMCAKKKRADDVEDNHIWRCGEDWMKLKDKDKSRYENLCF
jgi:hypothetical protein